MEKVVEVPYEVTQDSKAAVALSLTISFIKPKNIIETGTFIGLGTTSIIINSLLSNKITDFKFHSIETNEEFYNRADANLTEKGIRRYVNLWHGSSIAKELVPPVEKVKEMTKELKRFGLNIGEVPDEYLFKYDKESIPSNGKYGVFSEVMKELDGKLDLVCLDSAGQLGYYEFTEILPMIKSDCYFFLDDVFQLKHYKTYIHMNQDKRFNIMYVNREKFGFLLAKYTYAA
jgi:predicted O-methyltransferase YrrM